VIAALAMEKTPLRLALGAYADGAIRAKLAAVADDLDSTAHLGLGEARQTHSRHRSGARHDKLSAPATEAR
jgi:hypothetical protein